MGKKSISKNYFYNLFYQFLTIVLPLVTTPYLARVLGAEATGVYSYTLSIATYFMLFGSLGVALYGQREIAYLQNNKKKRTTAFFEILFFRFVTMSLSLLAFGIIYARNGQYSFYYRILIIELVSQALDISWFFQGMEDFKKTVIRNSIVKILFAASIFLFIKNPSDLPKYILIICLADLIGNLSLWMYIPKYISKIRIKDLNLLKHLKPIIILFIPQIAVQVYTVLDRTMIGKICVSKDEVGFYEQAQKLIKLCLTIVTSLGTVMIPRMANTFASGDMKKLREYMLKSFSFICLLAFPIMGGLFLIIDDFVPIFFGEGYDKVAILIKTILPIILFIGMSNLFGFQYLLPVKKQKEYTLSIIGGAVINFILNLFLIKLFASIGASISTVIAELTVTIIQFYFVRKVFSIKDFIKISKNNIFATIIMFLFTFSINRIFSLSSFVSIIVQTFVGIIIYVASLIILRDRFAIEIKNKIVNFLKKIILRKKVYR